MTSVVETALVPDAAAMSPLRSATQARSDSASLLDRAAGIRDLPCWSRSEPAPLRVSSCSVVDRSTSSLWTSGLEPELAGLAPATSWCDSGRPFVSRARAYGRLERRTDNCARTHRLATVASSARPIKPLAEWILTRMPGEPSPALKKSLPDLRHEEALQMAVSPLEALEHAFAGMCSRKAGSTETSRHAPFPCKSVEADARTRTGDDPFITSDEPMSARVRSSHSRPLFMPGLGLERTGGDWSGQPGGRLVDVRDVVVVENGPRSPDVPCICLRATSVTSSGLFTEAASVSLVRRSQAARFVAGGGQSECRQRSPFRDGSAAGHSYRAAGSPSSLPCPSVSRTSVNPCHCQSHPHRSELTP